MGTQHGFPTKVSCCVWKPAAACGTQMLHNVNYCGLLWLAVACCAVACCPVLYCVVLCPAMLCPAVLCPAMLCPAMLCPAMLCPAMLCPAMLCLLYCAVQTRPALHCRRGTVVATGGADKVVKLWDPSGVQTGTLRVSAMLWPVLLCCTILKRATTCGH